MQQALRLLAEITVELEGYAVGAGLALLQAEREGEWPTARELDDEEGS